MKPENLWQNWPQWAKRIFGLALFLAVLGFSNLIFHYVNGYTKTIPASGGTYYEAMLSRVQNLNPYYCYMTAIDRDLCSLVFSGLTQYDPVSKEVRPDIAYEWGINEEGTEYIFYLRSDVTFHDGEPLTAEDVVFSYQTVLQNPNYLGNYQMAFHNVTIEQVDDYTVKFILAEPDSFFPHIVTLGILPKHVLAEVDPALLEQHAFGRNPVGTGPFGFTNLRSENSYDIVELTAYEEYYGPEPYIKSMVLYGFSDIADLLQKQEVFDGIKDVNDPDLIGTDRFTQYNLQLPRVTGVFFNMTNQRLGSVDIRRALRYAIDKERLTAELPHVELIETPLPFINVGLNHETNQEVAKELLYEAGFKIFSDKYDDGIRRNDNDEKLYFVIATTKSEENVQTAQILQANWREIGVETEIVSLEIGDLQESLIKTRRFDILLIGEELQENIDLYPFFHSSQAGAPGLNLSSLKDVETDRLLDNIRQTTSYDDQVALTKTLLQRIDELAPSVYLYSPQVPYYVGRAIDNVQIPTQAGTIADRFYLFHNWAKEDKHIWEN